MDSERTARADQADGEGREHETVVDLEATPNRTSRWRIALLAALFVGTLLIAWWTGLAERLDVETVREMMQSAGLLGFGLFVGLFVVGELMHVPGMVFMGAASIAYGQLYGSLAAYSGALASVIVSFYVVRGIGGQPLGALRWKWARKVFGRLESHPIQTVAVLRLFMWVSPPLNYGLAMSGIRFRDYLIGSALGLALPVPVIVFFFDWFATWML